MTLAEQQARLTQIRTAITRALAGQQLSFGGRTWTSQDLAELRAMEAATEAALTALQGGSRSRVAAYDSGFQ